MRKSVIKWFKALTITALVSGMTWSCQEEKPEFNIPIPQKEFKYVETLVPDTLVFNEGDSVVFSIRTIPYNLISRDSITVQVSDTAGAEYNYAEIRSCLMNPADSIWRIVIKFNYGMEDGDIISLMLADKDTVLYSGPTVLRIIRKAPPRFYTMAVLNDSISGYLLKGEATLRLRTDPFDMLFDDSTYHFTITDQLGNPADELLTITGTDFQPEDSCWAVRFTLLNNSTADISVRARMECSDTVMVSDPVYFKMVSFKMRSVKIDNSLEMSFDSKTNTYSYCFPTTTRFSKHKFLLTHSGHRVTVGDSLLVDKEYNILDVSKPVTVSVWMYDIHKDYIIRLTNTGLPVVRITAEGLGMKSFDRSNWKEGITMRVELPDGTIDYEGTISLKGRGNGTWHEPKSKTVNGQTISKRPYAVRLDEKAKILGMHKQKRWILLANFKDRTLLRNDASYWLSRQTELPYTINGQFVELVWNGVHVGNYYLCEQARIDNHRIDIVNPNLEDPANGGFFMEIDTYYNYGKENSQWADKGTDIGFWSNWSGGFNLPYIFKDPDDKEIDANSAAYKYMYNYIKNMEAAIKNASNTNHDYEKYLDVDKAIDFALIQELTMNHDAYNTYPKDGPHSAFLYKDSAGLMCFGPMWDFDYHTFMPKCEENKAGSFWEKVDLAKEWTILSTSAKSVNGKYYFEYLLKDKKFKQRLVERWDMYKDIWKTGLPQYVDMMTDSLRVSESYNWQIWGSNNPNDINPNGDQNKDLTLGFQGAVDKMKQGFSDRWTWMNGKMNTFRSQVGM